MLPTRLLDHIVTIIDALRPADTQSPDISFTQEQHRLSAPQAVAAEARRLARRVGQVDAVAEHGARPVGAPAADLQPRVEDAE